MRLGHLGPAGTFTEEAARVSAGDADVLVPYPSVQDTVAAVLTGDVDAETALDELEIELEDLTGLPVQGADLGSDTSFASR